MSSKSKNRNQARFNRITYEPFAFMIYVVSSKWNKASPMLEIPSGFAQKMSKVIRKTTVGLEALTIVVSQTPYFPDQYIEEEIGEIFGCNAVSILKGHQEDIMPEVENPEPEPDAAVEGDGIIRVIMFPCALVGTQRNMDAVLPEGLYEETFFETTGDDDHNEQGEGDCPWKSGPWKAVWDSAKEMIGPDFEIMMIALCPDDQIMSELEDFGNAFMSHQENADSDKMPSPLNAKTIEKIAAYAAYLRKRLSDKNLVPPYELSVLTDDEILDSFRFCSDCGGHIYTKTEEVMAIMEYDTPERTFHVLDKKNHGDHRDLPELTEPPENVVK